jgi:DNA-binding IclR family transcriptional regulator
MSQWTLITNHGAVLSMVADRGQITAREIGHRLDLAERSVHRIISDLETEGYLEKHRDGRLNYYRVAKQKPLRRNTLHKVKVGNLLKVLSEGEG